MDNPLEKLQDAAPDWRAELAEVLHPYVSLAKGDVYYKPQFDQLSAADKVLVAVMAHAAMKDLAGLDEHGVRPSEIEESTGMPGGTIRPKLRELLDDRLVSSDGEGGYEIVKPNIRTAAAHLVGPSGAAA